MARPYIAAAHGAAGVGRVQGGGGEAAIAGSRLAGWLGRTMARPYIAAVCKAAALRCGVAMGRVAMGRVARSHHGATLHCGSARGCWQVVGAWFFRVFSWGFVTKW